MSDDINKNVIISVSEKGLEKIEKDAKGAGESFDDLEDSAKGSVKAVGDVRKQLREANKELLVVRQTFGETSKEAVQAAAKVGMLKDEINDARSAAAAFEGGGSFRAFTQVGQVAAGGFSAATGAMAIFGEKSEAVQETLLKVQAAMAFTQGLSSLEEMGEAYKNIKGVVVAAYVSITAAKTASAAASEAEAVAENQSMLARVKGIAVIILQTVVTGIATVAQWAWNIAMLVNPIGLLVIAITALIAAAYFLIKAFSDSAAEAAKAEAANKKLSKEIDNLAKSTEKSNAALEQHNQYLLDMAKASGKSSEEIRKLQQELINQEVAEKRLNVVKAQSIALEAIRIAGLEDATDAQKETAKKAYEYFKDQNKIFESSIDKRRQLALDQRVELAQEATDAREKAKKDAEDRAKDSKSAAEKAKKEKEKEDSDAYNREQKRLADNNKLELASLDEIDKIRHENDLYRMSEDEAAFQRIDDQYAKALENAKKFGQDTMAIDEAIKIAKEEVVASREAEDLQREYDRNEASFNRQKATAQQQLEFDIAQNDIKYQQEILLAEKTHADKLEITQRYNEANAELTRRAKEVEILATNEAAAAGAEALAESFGLAKELALAKMIMAAPEAIGNSFKTASAAYAPPTSLIMGALGAAGVVVPIIKGLNDIKKVRFSGSKKNSGGAASGAVGSVTSAVGNIGANNAARMGVDPSLEANATANASNKVMGNQSPGIVFSEGKYNDFQNQVKFKEGKSSI